MKPSAGRTKRITLTPARPVAAIATARCFRNWVDILPDRAGSREHGDGVGILHCIDATKSGHVTQAGKVWKATEILAARFRPSRSRKTACFSSPSTPARFIASMPRPASPTGVDDEDQAQHRVRQCLPIRRSTSAPKTAVSSFSRRARKKLLSRTDFGEPAVRHAGGGQWRSRCANANAVVCAC